jgi:CheY-like chemotaxis protein
MAKVLLVEDDPDSLEVVRRTLEKAGHLVVPASNGWEGLLALDAHHVDVIVLDLMMPGMNGNAFLRIVRNDRRRKAMPVVVLSALATGDLLKNTIELGVQAWFTKSEYTANDLLDAVDRLSHAPAVGETSQGPVTSRWQSAKWLNN